MWGEKSRTEGLSIQRCFPALLWRGLEGDRGKRNPSRTGKYLQIPSGSTLGDSWIMPSSPKDPGSLCPCCWAAQPILPGAEPYWNFVWRQRSDKKAQNLAAPNLPSDRKCSALDLSWNHFGWKSPLRPQSHSPSTANPTTDPCPQVPSPHSF